MNAKTGVNYYPNFEDKKTAFYKKSENCTAKEKEESRSNLIAVLVTAAAILAVAVWGISCAYSAGNVKAVEFPESVLSQEVASADQAGISFAGGELL